MGKWSDYHNDRRKQFLTERYAKPIKRFSDVDKIALADLGATCYHPTDFNGWDTREWLESIHCVLNHGCCTGCKARPLCEKLSK